ncbi:MAG: DNA repair protein RadA [Actinomycetota bacterium]
MAKRRRSFVCRECGAQHAAWTGRCPSCRAWASVEEVAEAPAERRSVTGSEAGAVPLASFAVDTTLPTPTGLDEVDRVLGGGLTPGSVTLLGGEPGVGKSTLTLQMATAVAAHGATALLVAGEEAPVQVAARADRLGPVPEGLLVIDDLTVDGIISVLESTRPQVAIVDSIQTITLDRIEAGPGSVAQLKAVTERLVHAAKRLQVSIVLIGHLTKEGSLAGPKVIEHLVDTVLSFGGDRSSELRYLRALKHRYGPTTEVGLFEMRSGGLHVLSDPSERFLADRQPGLPGSVVVATLEGRRPLLVELQALTSDVAPHRGSTTVQGVDGRRLAMVSAVLDRRVGYPLARHDLYVSATGGVKLLEPGVDLGLAVAVASSITDRPVAPEVVVCGEVGLGGEVRSVPQLEARLHEAYRLGFRTAIVPATEVAAPTGMRVESVVGVADALTAATGSRAV